MATRLHGFEIPIPPPAHQQISPPIEPSSEPTPSWPSTLTRPLSDIRELTEPSLIDLIVRHPTRIPKPAGKTQSPLKRAESINRKDSIKRKESATNISSNSSKPTPRLTPKPSVKGSSSDYSTTPEHSSLYAIPQSSIPKRTSSQNQSRQTSKTHTRKTTQPLPETILLREPSIVPNRGRGRSPVKDAGLNLDPITSDIARRIPSKTFFRSPHPLEILESPNYKHPRVKMELQVSAPIFAGGGTIEGFVKMTIDDNERLKNRKYLGIGAIAVDLLGYEEVAGGRRSTFLSLGTELLDPKHPPPPNMIERIQRPLTLDNRFWALSPSISALPFVISLPLDTGPPPFQSRHASIKFLLSTTALIEDGGKYYRVRTSQEVQVLPTYDPEKALTSLPSPLTAYDELNMPKLGGYESIKLTAGLHRQVWVSGGSIFVDVHIANRSEKSIRKLELNLERNILTYKHTAATTREKSVGQARIFESNDQTSMATNCLRSGSSGWCGVGPHLSETRTCSLELPRGLGTVKCGKYFEVRYFLNIIASVSNAKVVTVQLPIILIHMNSLDIVPNSVAQVAAAIEEKRANSRRRSSESKATSRNPVQRQRSVSSPACAKDLRRRPSYGQGRAFAAPRQQSLERQRAERADMDNLRDTVDSSPRKHPPQARGLTLKKPASIKSLANVSVGTNSTPSSGHSRLQWRLYHTPEQSFRAGRMFQLPTEREAESLKKKLRLIPSFDSVRSLRSTVRSKKTPLAIMQSATTSTTSGGGQNIHPQHIIHAITMPSSYDLSNSVLAPHTLGLTSTVDPGLKGVLSGHHVLPLPPPPPTPSASSFRERLDRSRFEFKAVRRKASGGLKERGISLWDHVRHRDREREGWI